jgi:heme oxygenase (mycobilin-producing)
VTAPRDDTRSGDDPITLINVFEVPAERVDAFVDQWRVRAELMAAAPGFRDARLHRAVSAEARFQLVNVAHWDSEDDMKAALGNDEFRRRVHALQEEPETRFAAAPAVYEVVADLGGG